MKTNRYFIITSLILALACMPTATFTAEDAAALFGEKGSEAKEIITKRSIFRGSKLPHLPISARQVEFLIDHPHLSLALAHIYDQSLDPYHVEVRPDHLIHVHDPTGLAGDAELIDARPGRRIYLISGYFSIFKMRVKGHMILKTVYSEQLEDTTVSVDLTTTAYIKVTSAFAGVFAQLADFLFPRKVDERMGRLLHAAQSVAIAVNNDPTGAYRELGASREVSEEELTEFAGIFLKRPFGGQRHLN